MIVQRKQIHMRFLRKHGNQYNLASLSRILDRLSHGDVVSGTVIDDIRLIGAEALDHGFPEILFPGIDRVICAACLCKLQTVITDIRDQHFRCAHCLDGLGKKNADRSAAENRHLRPLQLVKPLRRMHRDGKRFNHRAFIIAHAVRERGHPVCIHRKILARGAGRLKSHDAQMLAQIIFPVPAWIALSTNDLRFNGHFLAD